MKQDAEKEPEDLCNNCKRRPPYGYAGNGVYVPNLCKVCYKSGINGTPGRGYRNRPKGGKE